MVASAARAPLIFSKIRFMPSTLTTSPLGFSTTVMASPTMPVSSVARPAIIGSLGGSFTALSNTIVPIGRRHLHAHRLEGLLDGGGAIGGDGENLQRCRLASSSVRRSGCRRQACPTSWRRSSGSRGSDLPDPRPAILQGRALRRQRTPRRRGRGRNRPRTQCEISRPLLCTSRRGRLMGPGPVPLHRRTRLSM